MTRRNARSAHPPTVPVPPTEAAGRPHMQLAAMNLPVLRADDALARLEALSRTPQLERAVPSWHPGEVALVGQQYRVALQWLQDNPSNARAVYGERDVALLAESLRSCGQLQPVQAYLAEGPSAGLVLREGHTRVRAARRAGLKELRVELVAPTESAFAEYRASRELNVRRNNVTVFDDAVRLTEWLQDGTRSQTELGAALGLTEDYVSKALKVGRLPRLLLERMALCREPAFGVALAYLVAQFHEQAGSARTDRLISRVIEERLSVRKLEQLVRHGEEPSPGGAAPKRLRPLSRLEVTGRGQGELKVFADGRLELSLRELHDAERNALFSRLAQAMADAGLQVSGVLPDQK